MFIIEQHVPEGLEWDEHDAIAVHLLVLDKNKQPVACARLLEDGTVGRMAVVQEKRGKGIGNALLAKAITYYQKHQLRQLKLSAQTHAIGFYEQAGFVVSGDPYLDANILHVDMQLNI